MAKFIDKKVVKFVGYMDLDGNPISDWHEEYLGCAGLLCIYESEHKAPGKKFVYFFPNEPEAELQVPVSEPGPDLQQAKESEQEPQAALPLSF